MNDLERANICAVQACEHTGRLVDCGLAKPTDMYFTATVQRSSATLTVHVVLGHDYPTTSPLLALSLHWRSVIRTALNDEALWVSSLLYVVIYFYSVSQKKSPPPLKFFYIFCQTVGNF